MLGSSSMIIISSDYGLLYSEYSHRPYMYTRLIIGSTLCMKESTTYIFYGLMNTLELTVGIQSKDVADDLQELAIQVDHVRLASGLPTGKRLEWSDGMACPVKIPPPPTLPTGSPIYMLDYQEFLRTSTRHLQDIFRNYPAIVVSGRPTRLKCDLESLEEWGGVDDLRVMHGMSFGHWERADIKSIITL